MDSIGIALTAATLATAVLLSPKSKDEEVEIITEKQVSAKSNNKKLSLGEGWSMAKERLAKLKFKLSSTQSNTPADGNCLFHSIVNQCPEFESHGKLREIVCSNVLPMVEENRIFWGTDETMIDWIDRMVVLGTFGDEYCLQIIANLTGRDINLIPVHEDSAHYLKLYCSIKSDNPGGHAPIWLLWFEETKFIHGHFQSIEVEDAPNNRVLQHYNWTWRQSQRSVRTFSCNSLDSMVPVPIFTSSVYESSSMESVNTGKSYNYFHFSIYIISRQY